MNFYVQALLLGLALSSLSIGIFISMKIFNIPDITTDGSYTLGAVVAGIFLVKGYPLVLVGLSSFLSSALAGATTGLITTRLKVNPLLSGILVMTGLYSINLTLLGKANLPLIDTRTLFSMGTGGHEFMASPLITLTLFIAFIALLTSLLLNTDFGIAMRATGNSETMVRSLGVNTDRMKITGLAIANGLIGLSGFLVAQYQGYVDINMGIGIVITGLGSVVLGETLTGFFRVKKVWWRILGVLLGSVLFQLLLAVALTIGIDPNLLKLVTALLVLAVVSLPVLKLQIRWLN